MTTARQESGDPSVRDLGDATPVSLLRRADLWAGLASAAFGALILRIASDYPVGKGGRIGPGYAPRLLGGLLVGLGLLLMIRSTWVATPVECLFRPRPVVLVLASVVAFALVFAWAGLVPAVLATVLIANWASPENDWRSAISVAVLLAIFAWALFVVALKLPMPVFQI
jgi:hypothetical protein